MKNSKSQAAKNEQKKKLFEETREVIENFKQIALKHCLRLSSEMKVPEVRMKHDKERD